MSHARKDTNVILDVRDCGVTLDDQELLSGVSFTVNKGEVLAVIGPNGAGKTLLFKALLGLIPFDGKITWQTGLHVGYVPQRFPIDKTLPMTVREFFLLKAKRFWLAEQSFLQHLDHEISLVGISEELLERPIGALSGGQLQRLLIAWAMIDHPEVVLLDEPTAGIDIGFGESIYNLVRRLQQERGSTILLISHELSVIYRYADQVLCLNRQMVCHGKPREVLHPEELTRLFGVGGFYEHAHDVPPT